MATQTLATWAVSLKPNDIPDSVFKAALHSFYNWAGCAIGGSNHPTTTRAATALYPFFGRESTSSLLGSVSIKTTTSTANKETTTTTTTTTTPKTIVETADAQHATLLNGISSHVHDYDDTHLETIIHPTGPVASALLAYAETLSPNTSNSNHNTIISGRTFLLALTTGIEASCKLGLAVWPSHYDIGWHITSTTGSIGAAVAVGKLMNLSVEEMGHAIGIAATQVTGLREMFGSDTKSFHVGRASQNGLLAAILAQQGFTSSDRGLEAGRGWANVVCSGEKRLDELMGSLGRVWEIRKNSFKPFPCGIVVHPVIDACIRSHGVMNGKDWRVEEIEAVEARVHPLVLELTGKKTPKDGLQAKFSVYHGAAVGLVVGKATPKQYEDEVVLSRDVVGVRERITAVVDEGLRADECVVTLKMRDGSRLEEHVEHAIGSLEVPMQKKELEEKFVDQVGVVWGEERAREASEVCWGLLEAEDVGVVARELRGER